MLELVDFDWESPEHALLITEDHAPDILIHPDARDLMVETMSRVRLDKLTRETWRKFDTKDLEPLKWALLRRRRVLAMQLRP